ncbi:MAG: iron-containing alcohol dehydrogenase [Candidatus Hydrogenedentes bacterium]|nr:iron-containing alcohol dehydrogenase [Candidatus Hydrogenedentota bacterium]
MGDRAAERLAQFARAHCGTSCLVVSDENTRAVGGEQVLRALCDAGIRVTEKRYGGGPIDASQELGDEVAEAGAALDFFAAIGGGTLCDLAKHAGTKLERPAVLYPTAAAMNGYTSGIVAIKVRGLKRTVPCTPARAVFADPEVVATAPQRMLAAGVGDYLSKCSASADWRTAHFLREEYYDETALRFYDGVLDEVLGAVEAIGRAEPEAVALVLEALLLSGLSMLVAGSSAPASGGEHLISHYLDMKHALYGTAADLHGTQVGVATVHCLRLWEQVLELEPASLDIDALVAAQPSREAARAWIEEDWGPVAAEVHGQWNEKRLPREALRAELERFVRGIDGLRPSLLGDLLPSAVVADAIRKAGGPAEPEGLEASIEEYRNALARARFIRNRFTVLDLTAELGLA